MKFIITILLAVLSLSPLFAQQNAKLKELENRRKAMIQQIAGINKMLKENQKTSKLSIQKLQLIEAQISSRKKLIDLLSAEVAELDKQIIVLGNEIVVLENDLNLKKGEYGKAIQLMYMKRSSYEKLMFVFSANSLTQAYRRARYLKEYAVWSRLKGQEIMQKQDELNQKREELQNSKNEKGSLLAMRQQESQNLQTEENKQKVVIDSLKKEQRNLQATLVKQRKQAAALDRQIQKIIQEEVRRAQEEARRAAREEERRLAAEEEARRKAAEAVAQTKTEAKKPVEPKKKKKKEAQIAMVKPSVQPIARERKAETAGGYAMTREEKELSDDFSKNRGALPVPVTGRYTLIGRFGQQQHENLVYVVTNNNGVDIRTDAGSDARSIFKGVVTKVFAVPGYNSSIIVRHGNFLSVYSNLSQVYVKAGDNVGTRQILGKIYSDPEEGNQSVLHFQIWKETTKQNPEFWVNF